MVCHVYGFQGDVRDLVLQGVPGGEWCKSVGDHVETSLTVHQLWNMLDDPSSVYSNDVMEMHLRRLASKKYLVRTGDKAGAQHMLAQQAPGMQSDVAPSWMVSDDHTQQTGAPEGRASEAGPQGRWRRQRKAARRGG